MNRMRTEERPHRPSCFHLALLIYYHRPSCFHVALLRYPCRLSLLSLSSSSPFSLSPHSLPPFFLSSHHVALLSLSSLQVALLSLLIPCHPSLSLLIPCHPLILHIAHEALIMFSFESRSKFLRFLITCRWLRRNQNFQGYLRFLYFPLLAKIGSVNSGSHNLSIEGGGQINLTQSRKNAWSSTTENTQDNQPAHDDITLQQRALMQPILMLMPQRSMKSKTWFRSRKEVERPG
ncbi:hypothetical protein DY000_02039739 [Brassica cretica]|uniref:Uncharacterized protein n=1 Tax=Brassica cretica TaxID=69181 RepID=A0ABQ7BM13_BRACR|nr:hypothetical protein DY000_02039739 [Brassica cretica]